MAANKGTATVDFGAAPGSNYEEVAVADATIPANAYLEAWFMADTTADHTDAEHAILAANAQVTCGPSVAGVGFTAYVHSSLVLTGQFSFRWVWSS